MGSGMPTGRRPFVAVVGGGVAGLATAFELAARAGDAVELRLLEGAPRVGGNLRTEQADGYRVEWGPNGFLDSVPATLDLVRRLGLEDELVRADAGAARRFLLRRGRLHLLPSGPLSFLTSGVLSLGGRLRVLGEPWTRPPTPGRDETVHEFAARHLGEEAASVLVGAMVSGVFAGDARNLSLAAAFPKMAEMEAEHGSLVRAMVARGKARRRARRELAARAARGEAAPELARPGGPAGPAGTLTSFAEGIETLPRALARALGERVALGAEVRALAPCDGADGGPRYRLVLASGERLDADALVLAQPAPRAAPLAAALDGALGVELAAIPSAPLAVVALAYDAAAIGGAPRGFGFLAPRGQGLRLLGCLWDSSLFPHRAPAGKVLLRVMIGGALDPEAAALDDEELLATVRGELGRAMGIAAAPERTWVFRHRLGIAQYPPGHLARLARIEQRLAAHPGLFVAGQSYRGVAMNAVVEAAAPLAARVLASLASAPGGAPLQGSS